MKTIVTHMNPDLDAVASVWLLKRFGGVDFADAKVTFVPSGTTLKDVPADSDPAVVHVDTGLGRLDHHQSNEYTCAADKVFQYLKLTDPALRRLIEIVVLVDHAKDLEWADAEDDKWELWLPSLLTGYKLLYPDAYERQLAFGLDALDAAYRTLQAKAEAEAELAKGVEFTAKWGKAIACLTYNDSILDVGLKKGYVLVARKDPGKGYLRVSGASSKGVDLETALIKFREADRQATWYLHPSKVLLRNGSTKNPKMRPTSLNLEKIIAILKES